MIILILLAIIVALESAAIIVFVRWGKGFEEKTVESLESLSDKARWMGYDIDRIAKILEKKG